MTCLAPRTRHATVSKTITAIKMVNSLKLHFMGVGELSQTQQLLVFF